MLPYWMRIALGAFLGLVSAGALWWFGSAPWLIATAAALLAALGFLGSYFVWSADRPDEGYEQVLFDRPNTIVAAILLLAFAGLGLASGLLGAGEPAAASTTDDVSSLYAEYIEAADAFTQDEADAPTTLAKLDALRASSVTLASAVAAMPEGDERAALDEALAALGRAMDAMGGCVEGTKSECVQARLAAADVQTALSRARAV